MQASNTIAAIVGVRDEVSLIEACVVHLQAIGVPQIVVVDMGSSDGTELILQRLEREGKIVLVHIADEREAASKYLSAGLTAARSKFDPDWIFVLDADEFWLPATEQLAGILRSRDNVLFLRRLNAWAPFDRAWPRNLDDLRAAALFLGVPDSQREIVEKDALKWIRGQQHGKVIARTSLIDKFGAAGHEVIGADGKRIAPRVSDDGLIVHVPFTTFERFSRKVLNVKNAVGRHPEYFKNAGAHWTRWAGLRDTADIRREFEAQQLTDREAVVMKAQGQLVRAEVLLNYFRSKTTNLADSFRA
jgi:glycosyltransferase involved in cell wall biosynthesis